jgi:ABC-type branched-subunit amino acid transport system permease subunit
VSGFKSAAAPASKPDAAGARRGPRSLLPGLAAIALGTFYVIALLVVEEQSIIIALLAAGIVAAVAAHWTGMLDPVAGSFIDREQVLSGAVVAAVLAITVYFHADHFILLLVTTILLYVLATLGLNLQFGYAGVLNFAGASFFGVGGYTATVLSTHTGMPHFLVLLTGGVMAAFIGLLVLLPVLRTRGHYAAVVTIAFALLFRTFLEVNDVLGGPQGLAVPGFELFGWSFNRNIDLFGLQLSFYVNYLLMALLLVIGAFVLVRRLERSWIGLNLDAQRLDETAAICFGLEIVRWKTTAFVLGNFLIGLAGALFAMMIGFIAPTNFTFADSLIFVSIVLLGGLGNPWGLVVATAIVVIIPEKLQAIQEYRFLLYAALVMLMLLFRPDGLLPRPVRNYFPGWRPR